MGILVPVVSCHKIVSYWKGSYVCERFKLQKLLFHSHNFGHNGPLAHGLGIDGKCANCMAMD
jgi:hypothetical protein